MPLRYNNVRTEAVLALIAVLFAASVLAGQSIHDGSFRIAVLRTIFPGARIERESGGKLKHASPVRSKADGIDYPDALAGEPAYRVTGKPMNEAATQRIGGSGSRF